MRTLVVSDLHLGAGHGSDLLRLASFRERLFSASRGVDQIVLLGDVVELRDSPLAPALETAAPFFEALGRAAPGSRIVIVPGNHDHHLLDRWLEQRRLRGAGPLRLEQTTARGPGPFGVLARGAKHGGAGEIVLAYPGLWIADGVYATHGHYLDAHLTVPTFERLGVGLLQRVTDSHPDGLQKPDDYERIQAPLYAFLHALAQSGGAAGALGSNPSARVWSLLSGSGGAASRLRGLLLGAVALPGAVQVARRLGVGELRSDLSVEEIGRAGLRAMGTVVERLGIEAEHVIFGHSHRRGPLPGEADWTVPGGARLHNTGSWVWSPALVGDDPGTSGFWPGTVGLVESGSPPRLLHLLDGLDRERLSRAVRGSPRRGG